VIVDNIFGEAKYICRKHLYILIITMFCMRKINLFPLFYPEAKLTSFTIVHKDYDTLMPC
jgi:hypothetical protein